MFVMFVRQIVGITVYLLTMQHIMLHFSFLKYMYISIFICCCVLQLCYIYLQSYNVYAYMTLLRHICNVPQLK